MRKGEGQRISLLIEKGASFAGYEMHYGIADNTVLKLTLPMGAWMRPF